MDLVSQMTTFVRIVDGRSLSAAARSLGVSLPAVSRQLSQLEDDLGASLVVRSTRRLHVTEAGQRYYVHCQRVLGDIDQVRHDLRGGRTAAGTLVVAASFTFGTLALAPRLPALLAKHPGLRIDLRLEDRLTDLVGEGVDVAIRAGLPPPDSASVVAQPLVEMRRIVVAAPRTKKPRTPDDLARLPAVLQVTPAGSLVRWTLTRGAESVTVEPLARLRVSAPIVIRDLAVAGAGLAYLPTWLVEDDLAAGRLVRLLPEWESVPSMAYALFRTELRGAPRLRVLLAALSWPRGPRDGQAG